MRKVLLYSGGVDSYIISHLWNPDVKLFIDYGTEQAAEERKRLPADVIVKDINLAEYVEDDGINTIPLRNLIFSSVAVNYGDLVCIGGLKDDYHFDKTEDFCNGATALFNSVLTKERNARTVCIVAPFRKYTKAELIALFVASGGDLDRLQSATWSCHSPVNGKPCEQCVPCVKKRNSIEKAKEMLKQ